MKCVEKMQPAGLLARVQGGKREKFMVERLSSHRRRKRRHSACSLGRAVLATVHSILGSGTLGVLRVGFLMGLLGVDGFNG